MYLLLNPLSKQQKAFLKSENLLGYNKTAYQKDILNHIEEIDKDDLENLGIRLPD